MKKFLILLPALVLSLSACTLSGIINNSNNDNDDTNENNGGDTGGSGSNDYDDSIFDEPESLRKLMAFGKDTGFEITTKASSSDGEGEQIVFAMKGNTWWELDGEGYGTGYRLENNKCSMLTYSEGTWSVFIDNVGESQFEAMFESTAVYFYKANSYFANEGFVFDGNAKYAGRDVMKFKYSRSVATVSVKHDYYVDKDLGISLYQYAETTSDGEKDWAKLETTSFKTGNDVTQIAIAE